MSCSLPPIRPRVLVPALALVAGGCGGAETIDLVERFPRAHAFVETEKIDFGDPAARPFMVAGWSPRDELWAGRPEQSFAWGVGQGSELRVDVVQPRQDLLQILVRPRVERGEQLVGTLHVSLNGNLLPQALVLEPGWQEYVVRLPDRFVHPGDNRLGFGYDLPFSSGGDGNLRVAFDTLRLVRGTPRSYPRRDRVAGPPSLLVPFLSGVTYTLDTTEGSALVVDAVRAYGRPIDGPARLVVRIDHDAEVRVQSFAAPQRELRVDLPAATGLRVTLMAAPSDDFYGLVGHAAEQDAGVLLRRPVARVPR